MRLFSNLSPLIPALLFLLSGRGVLEREGCHPSLKSLPPLPNKERGTKGVRWINNFLRFRMTKLLPQSYQGTYYYIPIYYLPEQGTIRIRDAEKWGEATAMKLKDVKQLWGRDFEIVKEGLDESQVASVVAELVGERDMLLQRQEHLLSLTKLAERTIAEADKLAEDIKRGVEEEAKTKATKVLAKAEQEAQEIMAQKRSEILAAANAEAQAIKDSAQQEAELIVAQHKQRVQEELKEMAQKLHGQLVSELKRVTEQAVALQGEWESKLSQPVIDSLPSGGGEPPLSGPGVPEEGEKVAPPTNLEADLEFGHDVLKQLEQAWVDTDAKAGSEDKSAATPSETADQPDTVMMGEAITASGEEVAPLTYEGMVALDILPPLTPVQLVEIQKYLRDWPGIEITELSPHNNGYSIIVILYKPLQLIDILKQLPEVKDARECAAEEGEMPVDTAPDKDGLRRIAVTVCAT